MLLLLLKLEIFDAFQNIQISLQITATLPVTSCKRERSFSVLRRLKNYNRSTMVENRLNGLALMQIHQVIEPDVHQVLDIFASGNMRLDLT